MNYIEIKAKNKTLINFDNAKEAEEALKKIRSNLFKGV